MFQWTWLTLLAVTSVQTDGTINDWSRYSIKRISEEPLVYSMEMPTLQKPPTIDSFLKLSYLKREKRHLQTQETPAISIPPAVRQRRCHAAERHLQNFRNQPSVLDESNSMEQPETTKRDVNSTYGHDLRQPTMPTVYIAPKKNYNALKDYLSLMHQMQRDAYNTLQNKLKETITRTKQPWRDDHLTRLEKPFSATDWDSHSHVSTPNFPSYDGSPKWHGSYSPQKSYESVAPVSMTHESNAYSRVPIAASNHHYLGSMPIGDDVGIVPDNAMKAVGNVPDPVQNHYMDSAQQLPMKSMEALPDPTQNHFNYGTEEGHSESVGSHVDYVGTEHSHSIPQETLQNSRQDGSKETSKPLEEVLNPNSVKYIDSEHVQNKPMETHLNEDYIGGQHTESKPLVPLLHPGSDDLNYNSEQMHSKTFENLPIPSQDDFSYIPQNNIPNSEAQILPTVVVPNEDQKLPTPTSQENLQQVKNNEKEVNNGNVTQEVAANEPENTTERSQNAPESSATEKPETRTETPQKVTPSPESHARKLERHSKNLAQKMKNLTEKKKDLDEMVATILNMERTSPTADPAAQADLQKIMESIQEFNKNSQSFDKSTEAPVTPQPQQPTEATHVYQNSGTQLAELVKTQQGENNVVQDNSDKTVDQIGNRQLPSVSPKRIRTDPVTVQPEILQSHQVIQEVDPQWFQNSHKTVDNLYTKPEKPLTKIPRKLQKAPQATTSPYQVILLKDKVKKAPPVKPAKKLDYPLKFLRQIVKPDEPYQIVEVTTEPSNLPTTESPEDRLIKLLATSAEPEVIDEIKYEMRELKRYFSEDEANTTVKPTIETTSEKAINPTQDKIIIPFDQEHPKIIMIDPNELHSQQIHFVESPSKLGEPVFSFHGGDPFENDDLAKSAPETESSEEPEEYQEEVEKGVTEPKNFPWSLYYPNIGTANNTTANSSAVQTNPVRSNPAPRNQALVRNFEEYHQKAAENYERLLREREERLKNLRESNKKPLNWSRRDPKPYPTKTLSRLPTEQPFSQNFPQYATNYPYDPSMVQGTPMESQQVQNFEPHLPEKRSCDCGDTIESQEQMTFPSNSLSDCPCRRSKKPSQARKNDLSDFLSDRFEKKVCSSDESLPVESKKASCGCHDRSESEEVPKNLQASQKTCSCGGDHDDCDGSNVLRHPRSHQEPNKYEILNNVLMFFKRFANKDLRL